MIQITPRGRYSHLMPRPPAPAERLRRDAALRRRIDQLNAAAGRRMDDDLAAGLRDAEEAQRLATITAYPKGLADSLFQQMHGHIQTGSFPAAASCGRRALALYREQGDRAAEGQTLYKISLVFTHAGNYPSAELFAGKTARMAAAIGNPALRIRALRQAGVVQYLRGRHDAATRTFESALQEAALAGEPDLAAMLRMNLGIQHTAAGRWEMARGYLQESLDYFSTAGNKMWEATVLSNLGVLFQKQHRHREAAAEFMRCLRLSRATGYTRMRIQALINLGDALPPLGDFARADRLLAQAEKLAARSGEKRSLAYALESRGRLETARRKPGAAKATMARALEIARAIGETDLIKLLTEKTGVGG